MAISLSKGERINLSKEAPGLKNAGIGLGWDLNTTDTGSAFDLDASVFMLGASGKIPNEKYLVFYNNLESPDASVKSLGDSKTGEGTGDDETVQIDLSLVDASVQEIVFVVTIHEAHARKQNFGQVRNSFIKIYDNATKTQIAKYELESDFSTETAIEFGKLYKKDGDWRFQAVGQGYKAGLQSFVDKYHVEIKQEENKVQPKVESPVKTQITSSVQSAEREVGIRTTDPNIVQGLINGFDGAQVQDAQAIDESLTAGSVRRDDAEALDAQDRSNGYDFVLVNPNEGEADQDVDYFAEDNQGTAINAEEFLRRYKAGESDFTGINLAGANLSGVSLSRGDVNLSRANLTRANLSKANLTNTNLSGAKLSEANLIEASLTYAILTGADLRSAELSAAQLNNAKLVGTNLSGAGLIQANLAGADLSEANLNYTNLTAASLQSANLMKASLKGTNLTAANLSNSNLRKAEFNDKTRFSGANLRSVNLAGQNLQKINMSGVNMSNANLCGTLLCFSNLSGADFTSADLRGADLGSANLEKANLKGANLSGANLDEAKLSGAIMPDGSVHD